MTPNSIHELIVMINNGADRTLMKTLTFVKGVGHVTNYSTIVNSNETMASVTLTTNLKDYKVEIPAEAQDWLSLAPATRAATREEVINFSINTNSGTTGRSAVVKVLDMGGVEVEKIYVLQNGTSVKRINVNTDGHLSSSIGNAAKTTTSHLYISGGTLDASDFNYISTMTNLKYLDMSEADNKTLPAGTSVGGEKAGIQGYFETLILPNNLTSIPEYCFYNFTRLKGDLIIPDKVTTIGRKAFFNCSGLDGNLVIGESVKDIGDSSFAMDAPHGTGTPFSRCLYFQKIYCKATEVPTIYLYFYQSTSHYSSSFGSMGIAGQSPYYLGVNKGCRNSYLHSTWSIILNIEEVDFDELGY